MNTEEIRKGYGEEYPAAIVFNGVRMTLSRETRFHRIYSSPEGKTNHMISRFHDGSAAITLSELERDWPGWTEFDRIDFCNACSWLYQQTDFPEMLRFIMQHSGPTERSAVALAVSSQLPRDEAFEILLRALRETKIGKASNITQAIAKTKHPDAEGTLRNHLQSIWAHACLWDNDPFLNWVAFDATTCIVHLIELGASPASFEESVHLLSQHVCSSNRDSCRRFLAKYYSWLH